MNGVIFTPPEIAECEIEILPRSGDLFRACVQWRGFKKCGLGKFETEAITDAHNLLTQSLLELFGKLLEDRIEIVKTDTPAPGPLVPHYAIISYENLYRIENLYLPAGVSAIEIKQAAFARAEDIQHGYVEPFETRNMLYAYGYMPLNKG